MKFNRSEKIPGRFIWLSKVTVVALMTLAVNTAFGQMMGGFQAPVTSALPVTAPNPAIFGSAQAPITQTEQPKSDDAIVLEILKKQSKTLDSASCRSSDGSSCEHCKDPLPFILCVKDGSEAVDQMNASGNMVWNTAKAKGTIRQATTTLGNTAFNRDVARTAASLHLNAISANGFPVDLIVLSVSFKSKLRKGLELILKNGYLPQPSRPPRGPEATFGVGITPEAVMGGQSSSK